MKFEPEDAQILKKIGVTTLLDLALLLPKSWEDLSVSQEPKYGECSVEIETKSMRCTASMLSVTAFCKTWEREIRVNIFNALPWHYGAFKGGKTLRIHGRTSEFGGIWQFNNPKIIKDFGGISTHYKTALKDGKVAFLIQKYVNSDSLIQSGLSQSEAENIASLQKCDAKSVDLLANLSARPDLLASLKFAEIYNYMKKLRAKKLEFAGFLLKLNDISKWLESLPFRPTNDQIAALDDIRSDFMGKIATKRVIMGDVGSGKTLVMLGAALLIYPQKAIIMAPTSILAEQIYTEALRLLPDFMNIILIKKGERDVNFQNANLIIGTHVLLYRTLPSAPLVMVDEQHRFGSNQRAQIDTLTSNGEKHAHFLQFSATPIPRTLGLIQSNIVKFSFLKQIPYEKRIHTIILQNSGFASLLTHLRYQIAIGKQAAIIYPLVEESENIAYQSISEAASFWFSHFKRVFVTHGKDKNKEQIISEFAQNGDILLATTIIEVGISLPRLSTIVVVGGERLGLATLHQLRGRVGRNGGEGWCYIYTKLKEPPQRLIEFAQTLDGFKVANLDLKNRQAGDILGGTLQHGATFNFYEMEEEIAQAAKNRLENVKFKNEGEFTLD